MTPDDQFFQPGERVVRVGDGSGRTGERCPDGSPVKGRVYCVDLCWYSEVSAKNLMLPVGFGRYYTREGKLQGWPANAFRRVAEVGHPAIEIREEQPA